MFSDMELHRSNRAPPLKIFPHLFTRLVRPDLEIANVVSVLPGGED